MDTYNLFSEKLIHWYEQNKRDLPWRNTSDPYKIWLSEVILQQTRVDQGKPYYDKFIREFPKIGTLAQADEDKVMQLWQGLGYYSRARNLHRTAKYIYKELKGKFPNNYNELLKLTGVGPYTAAAIASFSFGEVQAVVDGNVIRVISRLFGIQQPVNIPSVRRKIELICAELICKTDPATFNQAIMEFGAIQCTPKKPECGICVFNMDCKSHLLNLVDEIPAKKRKSEKKDRYIDYFLFYNEHFILLKKRIGKGIWQGLFEGLMIESDKQIETSKVLDDLKRQNVLPNYSTIEGASDTVKHVLSHQNLYIRFWKVIVSQQEDLESLAAKNSMVMVNRPQLSSLGFPIVIWNYLEREFLEK